MNAVITDAETQLPQDTQPDHYDFEKYVTRSRWASYWHQVRDTLNARPESVLVIGTGDGIVPAVLRSHGIDVCTFDCDSKLSPDFVGDVRHINAVLMGRRFDVVVCCQVLEHIVFDDFENTIQELAKCAKTRIVLSLPYRTTSICTFFVSFLKIRPPKLSFRVPHFWHKWKFNGQHHWEVGTKGFSKRQIANILLRHATPTATYLAKDNEYHLFFILKPHCS